jgi:hypothetical protein
MAEVVPATAVAPVMGAATGMGEVVATTAGEVITVVVIMGEAPVIARHLRGQGPAAATVPAQVVDGMAIPVAVAVAGRGQGVPVARAATSVRMAGLVEADTAAPAVAIAESCKNGAPRGAVFYGHVHACNSGTGFSREEASADTLTCVS